MTLPYDPAPGYTPAQSGPGNTASWTQRATGTLIDAVVLAPGWLIYIVGAAVGSAFGTLLTLLGLVVTLGITVYQVYLEGTTGQSIGKRRAGIRLIGERTGQPIGFGPAFVRKLCHIVDSAICYVGWLWPLWDEKRQTLADKITGTVVVAA
jgi:uncharacterized RDD family membrane protein YckC